MQITSTFILAAIFALKATIVIAAPFMSAVKVTSVEARDLAPIGYELEARSFDDEIELEAREFDDDFDLDARDFDDYEEVEARLFNPRKAVSAVPRVGGLLRIPVHRGRLTRARLSHVLGGHSGLRSGRLSAGGGLGHASRSANKIHGEKHEMASEMRKIHAEERRIKKQGAEMKLQETIHKDRKQLRHDGAF